jgi:glycosyltransferase involved in cell wall biosynthesis
MTQDSTFQPIYVLEIELSQPISDLLPVVRENGTTYTKARALVRLYGQALGTVDFSLPPIGLCAEAVASHIWRDLNNEINTSLANNHLPEIYSLGTRGVRTTAKPACVKAREEFMPHAPFASVVIATRNRPTLIGRCLTQLQTLNYAKHEIIVVDNNPSNDATYDVIKSQFAHAPHIRYVRENRPGLSWARDCGLAHAKGEIVAFTDDDVQVDTLWLLEMAKGFTLAENVGCVTGIFVASELETEAQVWFEEYGGWHKRYKQRIFNLSQHHTSNRFFPYNAWVCGSGANIAFKTNVLREIGGFATELSTGTPAMAGEEAFSFFSTLTRGYTIVHEPSAIVYHTHRRDYAGFKRQIYGYGVSTTAYLTKVLVSKPSRIGKFAALAVPGIQNLFKNHVKHDHHDKPVAHLLNHIPTYPDELMQIERKGKIYGPLAYFKSVINDYKVRRAFNQDVKAQNANLQIL